MLFDIFKLLLDTAASLLTFCLLLRVLMQWVRVHPSNPLSPFIFSMTNWLVKPLRKVIPGYGGVDWASVLAALVVAFVLHFLVLLMAMSKADGGTGVGVLVTLVVPLAILWVLKNFIYLLFGIILIQAILSWVNPYSPMSGMLNELSAPFLKPLRKVVPTVGNVDLSPLALLIILQIVLMILQRLVPGI